jgi:hypothetical protein
MDTLVFKNGGVFTPLVPTIHCKTCKDRRHERLCVLEKQREKGFVFITILVDVKHLENNLVSINISCLCHDLVFICFNTLSGSSWTDALNPKILKEFILWVCYI